MTTILCDLSSEPPRRRWRRTATTFSAFVLIGLSAFMVVPMWLLLTRDACACSSRVKDAYQGVMSLQGAIERYRLEKNDRCPKNLADLKAANLLRSADLRDPWGHPYMFLCRDELSAPLVCSFGDPCQVNGPICSYPADQYPAR